MVNLLLKNIKKGKIINNRIFYNCDFDELLDLRDEECFDSEWMRVYNLLNNMVVDKSYYQIIDEIRKETYLRAYKESNSSDIASCVSDDFELIVKAYILNVDDQWLNSIIMLYAKSIFPCGNIILNNLSIDDSFKMLVQNSLS